MGYSELTSWMFNLERFGIKLGLENITEFLARIGNPERDFKSIHVAGTNGKGSVCTFTAEILKAHGLRVGLYTSPHLVDFRERIKINGREISQRDVVRLGSELKITMEEMASESSEKQLTFFEFTTGLAFKYFSERKVDIVVAEVGMGGRLDATNVLLPEVSAITRIGLEHMNYLGSTIPEIAREKAGIIKTEVPIVTCERNPEALAVIENACTRKDAALRKIGKDFEATAVRQTLEGTEFDYHGDRDLRGLRTHLLGGHQAENAAAAIAILEVLSKKGIAVSESDINTGLCDARWPGRLDILSNNPLIILDGSHNPDGVATTVRVLERLGITPLTFVLGCMDDKDARGIVRALGPVAAKIVVTQARYKRALPSSTLAAIVLDEYAGPKEIFEHFEDAFERARRSTFGKGLCVIGSLYLVGEAIQYWRSLRRPRSARPHKV